MAWPIILANCTVPILGLVDTAVIGRTGDTTDLGAIALGALIFNFIYWSFGFLRMGTTGFVARAVGSGEEDEVRATLGRTLLLAAVIGLALIALQWPISWLAMTLLSASGAAESIAMDYVMTRIWGAPASLGLFAILGVLVGLGESRTLLKVQLVLNGGNIAFDILFAGVLGWGPRGIAVGTALAEWLALGYGLQQIVRLLQARMPAGQAFWPNSRIFQAALLKQTLHANADIMLRTLALLFGFFWFVDQSARFGDTLLAGNHILMQFIAFSAFFLDGFAFVAESQVGQAAGAGQRAAFDRCVRLTTHLAAAAGLALGLFTFLLGPWAVTALTDLQDVRAAATTYLPYAAAYIVCSFMAFQLDGVFIGTARTRDLRQASIMSTVIFLLAWWPLSHWLDNDGLWLAFIVFVIARAAALGWHYNALRASIASTRN